MAETQQSKWLTRSKAETAGVPPWWKTCTPCHHLPIARSLYCLPTALDVLPRWNNSKGPLPSLYDDPSHLLPCTSRLLLIVVLPYLLDARLSHIYFSFDVDASFCGASTTLNVLSLNYSSATTTHSSLLRNCSGASTNFYACYSVICSASWKRMDIVFVMMGLFRVKWKVNWAF